MIKTFPRRILQPILFRHFTKSSKEPSVKSSAISSQFEQFKIEKKKYENMMLEELERQHKNSLARTMDCYSTEIRLELFFHVIDEHAVYLETILNYLGLLYRQNCEGEYLDRLPVYLSGFLGLNIKKEEVKLPAMRIYETFEDERWIFGSDAIIQALVQRRVLTMDNIKKDPWALAGAEFIQTEFKPVLDFIFQYPIVILKVGSRTKLRG